MKDKIIKNVLLAIAIGILVIGGGFVFSLVSGSLPAFREYGFFKMLAGVEWKTTAGAEQYGMLPFMVGTLMTALTALLLCVPFALPMALFTGEYFRGKVLAQVLQTIVDLLAGIPSIIYGLWGFYTLRPLLMHWGLSKNGFDILTASVVLAIMIIPYVASLSSQFIKMVPADLKEAAYAMGATRKEVVTKIVFPTVSTGILSTLILALGRAIGETMAVTMLVGNTNKMPHSLLDSGNTMASLVANQFCEASGIRINVLMAIALVLFVITLVVNSIGRFLIKKVSVQ